MILSETEVLEWKKHQVTKEWFKYLRGLREDMKEAWSNGVFTGESSEATAQLNANALGKIQMLADLLESDFLITEEEENAKH